MNGQLLRLQAELRRAHTPSQSASTNSSAAQLLAARAAALSELIDANPTEAAAIAFPASVLAQLGRSFPAATASLEKRGHWQGELEFSIEDDADMKTHRDIFKLRGNGETLDVKFAGKQPPGLMSGMKLVVGGVRAGKNVAVEEMEVVDAGLDGSTTSAQGSGAQCGATTGPQSVLSVLVDLPSYSLPSTTDQNFVRSVLLGNTAGGPQSTPDWSVNDFWRNNSQNKTYIDNVNVVGPVALSSNYNANSSCDYYGIQDEVLKAIDGQVDFRRYSRIQIVMPGNGACTWSGMANVGCRSLSSTGDGPFTAAVAWQRADKMLTRERGVQVSTHEMGHNFGLRHGQSRDFGADAVGAIGAAGALSEYGDPHSVMGSMNFGFYSASHAANQLGWLASGNGYQTVESSGTYVISNYEAAGNVLRALKIRRGTGNDAWLWVESRQNTGIYSSQLSPALFGGALVHYQDAATTEYSHLLDFTPGSSSGFTDAPLPAGSTWSDPYSNVSVTVNSVTNGAMTVTVNYNGVTCTSAAPTLTASPTGVATEYGSSTQFNVVVKNNSSAGCGSETFNLADALPDGWTGNYDAAALTVNPGQQATTVLKITVPAPYTLGTYPVTSRANSALTGKSASDTENVTVVEPTGSTVVASTNRLTANIAGNGSVTFSSPARTCTTSCYADYADSTANVTLTAKASTRSSFSGWSGACTGTADTCTVTMSSAMTVSASFKKTTGKK